MCPLIWLAVYTNGWLEQNPNATFLFTTNDDDKLGPKNINQQYANRVGMVCWKDPELIALEDQMGPDQWGLVGTHSLRKFACTTAARRGATTRMVEFRGRWVVESSHSICAITYISAEDKYANAFAAHCLYDGGSIKYELRADADVTDQWMFTNVVPYISSTGFKMTTCFCVSWVKQSYGLYLTMKPHRTFS
jgi:hypothetical protein